MIQGKGRNYFHETIMKTFMKNILDEKGHEITYMNKLLQAAKSNTYKRKLPERKEKFDKCGRMLLNERGLNNHMKRMHGVEASHLLKSGSLTRSDYVSSTRSAQSVKSPPPKKIQSIEKQSMTPSIQ